MAVIVNVTPIEGAEGDPSKGTAAPTGEAKSNFDPAEADVQAVPASTEATVSGVKGAKNAPIGGTNGNIDPSVVADVQVASAASTEAAAIGVKGAKNASVNVSASETVLADRPDVQTEQTAEDMAMEGSNSGSDSDPDLDPALTDGNASGNKDVVETTEEESLMGGPLLTPTPTKGSQSWLQSSESRLWTYFVSPNDGAERKALKAKIMDKLSNTREPILAPANDDASDASDKEQRGNIRKCRFKLGLEYSRRRWSNIKSWI